MALLTTLKGLPLTYNRDLQEDKEGLFDALDTVKHTLATFAAMLDTLKPVPSRMQEAASDSFLMATDLAEWLVRQGVPFRDAHHQVGRFVAACIARGQTLADASLEQMRECIPAATEECLQLWDAAHSVAARNLPGGTAPAQVQARLAFWKDKL
jgi:argininosuccinate lyase